MNLKEYVNHLFYGYIRNIQNNSIQQMLIPNEVVDICIKYWRSNIFKGNEHCIIDLNNKIFTTKGSSDWGKSTYCIIESEWSKHTNNGIHKIKLKCLKSGRNPISIGMVTNNKTKT
eukprot:520238_1